MNETNIRKALACISLARDIIKNEPQDVNTEGIISDLSSAAVTTASLLVPKNARETSVNSILSSFGMDDLKFERDCEE